MNRMLKHAGKVRKVKPLSILPKMNIYMYGLPDIIKEAVLSVTQHERMSLNKLFQQMVRKILVCSNMRQLYRHSFNFCGELRWKLLMVQSMIPCIHSNHYC